MLDIQLLRKDLDAVVARLQTRKNPQAFLNVDAFKTLEAERKTIQTRTEELQSKRNQLSKQIGMLMGKGEKDAAEAAKAEVAATRCALRLALSAARLMPNSTRCRPSNTNNSPPLLRCFRMRWKSRSTGKFPKDGDSGLWQMSLSLAVERSMSRYSTKTPTSLRRTCLRTEAV